MKVYNMEALILNDKLIAIGIIDAFDSFIWVDRYSKCGDFEIYVPANSDVFNILSMDNYLVYDKSEHVMIVEGMALTTDIEDGNKIIVSGRSVESILDRRIVWNKTILSGNFQNGIKKLLEENIIYPQISERKDSRLRFVPSDDPEITSLTIDAQLMGESLYDVIVNLCESQNIGWKITLSDDNYFNFKLYSGVDHSFAQNINNHIIFSPNFDNFLDSNYVRSKKEQKTVVLVAGETPANIDSITNEEIQEILNG